MFVVIEGPDGSGKTTTTMNVTTMLQSMGYTVHTHREPGGSKFGEDVRQILFKYPDLSPLSQLLLFSGARNELVRSLQIENFPREVFLFDRYVLSSYVYQYDAYYQNRTLTEMLFEHTFPSPDLTVVLNASLRTLMARQAEKAGLNHFDMADIGTLETRRNLYLDFARRDPLSYIVDTERNIAYVAQDVVNLIVQRYSELYGT